AEPDRIVVGWRRLFQQGYFFASILLLHAEEPEGRTRNRLRQFRAVIPRGPSATNLIPKAIPLKGHLDRPVDVEPEIKLAFASVRIIVPAPARKDLQRSRFRDRCRRRCGSGGFEVRIENVLQGKRLVRRKAQISRDGVSRV